MGKLKASWTQKSQATSEEKTRKIWFSTSEFHLYFEHLMLSFIFFPSHDLLQFFSFPNFPPLPLLSLPAFYSGFPFYPTSDLINSLVLGKYVSEINYV